MEDKSQAQTSTLLTRNSNKQSFVSSGPTSSHTTAGMRTYESNEFKLSPIHGSGQRTGMGLASRSLVSEESTSALSSVSSSSVSERNNGFTLTPLNATKQLTAGDSFRSSPAEKTSSAPYKTRPSTTLSPLQPVSVDSNAKHLRNDLRSPSPEKTSLKKNDRQSKIGLSPVRSGQPHAKPDDVRTALDRHSPTHKHTLDGSLLLQQETKEKITKSHVSGEATLPEDDHKATGDALESQHQVEHEGDDSMDAAAVEPLGGDLNGLGDDFSELQSALQAAGLPPMRVEKEQKKEDPVQLQAKEYPSVNISMVDPNTSSTSAAKGADNEHSPLADLSGDHVEPAAYQSVPTKPVTQRVAELDLRDAIREIASEELSNISKEILKQGWEEKVGMEAQQYPLLDRPSPVLEQKTDIDIQSSLPQRGHELSQTLDKHLEEFADLVSDLEPTKDDKSDKSSNKMALRSSARNLPKASTKGPPSKKAPMSKISTRLSSKLKTPTQSSTKPSLTKKDSLSATSKPRPAATTVSRASSAGAVRGGSKVKTQSHAIKSSPSLKKSATNRINGRATSSKQVGKPAVPASRSTRRDIVIPTGSGLASDSSTDSADDVTMAAGEEDRGKVKSELEAQVDMWKKALHEEKEKGDILSLQMAEKEKTFAEKEQQLREAHRSQVNQLNQEILMLTIKLKDAESAKDPRQLLALGEGEGLSITEEEKSSLAKDIREQEVLIQGYQKENERLYAELTRCQKESKLEQARLFKENQRLASEVLNTRTQLEKQTLTANARNETPPTDPTHSLEAARISQLEDKLERASSDCNDLQNQVKQLKHSCQSFDQEAKEARHQVRQLEVKMRTMVNREQLQLVKEEHKDELSALNQKLEWYAENQRLLDRDCELLHSREQEIATLKAKLASMESEGKQNRGARSRAAEARRVQQLEQQVREMENIIKKRFPNSLSALILSTGVAEGQTKTSNGATQVGVASTKSAPPTRAFLQKRVHQLEDMLENKDKECARKLRALQQKYTALEVAYEKQISSLKERLASVVPQGDDEREVRGTGESGEVAQLKSKVDQLQLENCQLREAIERQEPVVGVSRKEPTAVEDKVQDFLALDSLKAENEQLKEKLSEVNFELAHQRVQLQGKVAETESRAAIEVEAAKEKLVKLESEHRAQMDSLIAKYAKQQSRSETTRLQSQLATREATIIHLREKVKCLEFDVKKLSADREREERMKEQVKVLTEQLLEAKRHHTPEMYHFMALQTKIASLEHKCNEYELAAKRQLQVLSQPLSESVEEKVREVEQKWRRQLLEKNSEIEQYREELDSLLSAMQVLKQGV